MTLKNIYKNVYFYNLIKEVINKKTNSINIEVVFSCFFNNDLYPSVYKHVIELGIINDIVKIKKELIYKLTGHSIKKEMFKNLIEVIDGEIKDIRSNDIFSDLIIKSTLNLLDNKSIVTSIDKLIKKMTEYNENSSLFNSLIAIKLFSLNISA